MSLFKGNISKSAADLSKPFRKRFCTVCWEEINLPKDTTLKRKSTFQIKGFPKTHLPTEANQKKLQKQLVLTYYKDEKYEETGDYKG